MTPAIGRSHKMRVLCLIAAAAVLTCIQAGISMGATGAADQSSTRSAAMPRWAQQFPLDMAIPVNRYAFLDEGNVRQRRWAAYVFRPKGATDSRSSCIYVGSIYYGGGRGGVFSDDIACGRNDSSSQAAILVASGFSTKKSPRRPLVSDTVVGIGVPPKVTRVLVEIRPRPSQSRVTRMLSAKDAMKARVGQFRFVAFAVARRACVVSVAGYDSSGAQVLHPQAHSCGSR